MKETKKKPPGPVNTSEQVSAEEYAANVRESIDTIAAVNIAFDNDTSISDALDFVKSHRPMFERFATELAEDQPVSDTARAIQIVTSERQRGYAKKDRPKSEPTFRSMTIAEMRSARRRGVTLPVFLEIAEAGDLDTLSIRPGTNDKGEAVFVIDRSGHQEEKGTKNVKAGTLNEWWAEAGDGLTTD